MRLNQRIRSCLIGSAAVLLLLSGCSGPSEITVTSFSESEDSGNESVLKSRESETLHFAETIDEALELPAIAVYVCGAVAQPDVYYLPAGARIYDALKAAGGFLPGADTQWLNQAQVLTDGEMLLVYTLEETARLQEDGVRRAGGPSSGGLSSSGSKGVLLQDGNGEDSAIVNLNSGTKEQLMTLPGIGESKADAIIRYRTENGSFASVEDIMNISGIKNSTFDKLKDRITV